MVAKPQISLVRKPVGLVPADSWSEDRIGEIPFGVRLTVHVSRSRSVPQNSLYWSVLHEVCEATEGWPTAKHLHVALLMDLGYRTIMQRMDGAKYWIPDSTSFDKMDAEEFKKYFDQAMKRLAEVVKFDPLQAYDELRGISSPTIDHDNSNPSEASPSTSPDDAPQGGPASESDGESPASSLSTLSDTDLKWLAVAARMLWGATPRTDDTEEALRVLNVQRLAIEKPEGLSEFAREKAGSIYVRCKECLLGQHSRGDTLRYIASMAGLDTSDLEG